MNPPVNTQKGDILAPMRNRIHYCVSRFLALAAFTGGLSLGQAPEKITPAFALTVFVAIH